MRVSNEEVRLLALGEMAAAGREEILARDLRDEREAHAATRKDRDAEAIAGQQHCEDAVQLARQLAWRDEQIATLTTDKHRTATYIAELEDQITIWVEKLAAAEARVAAHDAAYAQISSQLDVTERAICGLEAERDAARAALRELQDAISPSRAGTVENDYYVKVVKKMREREEKIHAND